MIQLEKDLEEARLLLDGSTSLLCELRHLRALQLHHEDSIIGIANKLGLLHEAVMGIE
jgi:hypothetical protein